MSRNKRWLLEIADNKQIVVTSEELLKMEQSAQEFDGFEAWTNKGSVDEAKALLINLTPLTEKTSNQVLGKNHLDANNEIKGILGRLLICYSYELMKAITEQGIVQKLAKDPTLIQEVFDETLASFKPDVEVVMNDVKF